MHRRLPVGERLDHHAAIPGHLSSQSGNGWRIADDRHFDGYRPGYTVIDEGFSEDVPLGNR